jgi:hypothetical protein
LVFTLFHHHAVEDVPDMLIDQGARVVLEQPLKFFLIHGQGECLIQGRLRARDISLICYEVQSRREFLNDANQAHTIVN